MVDSTVQASPPPPPAPAPVGARWVAGLGAFLLVAAAATFVAVRWDELPDQAKLGMLLAVTGLCLAAHRRLRSSLPVTAAAVFHLGVLLVPIDVAAIGVQGGWAWPHMLLAQGLAAAVTFGVAGQIERSVVLRVAAWAGVVALAGGIGGSTPLPAGLVLVVAAGAAAASSQGTSLDRGAAGWATLAGLAVPLAGAERLGWPAAGVLTDLGLATPAPHGAAAVTGLLAAVVLGSVAQRYRNMPLALLGVGCGFVGLTTSFVGLEPGGDDALLAGTALILLVQVAAWTWRHDTFWAEPAALVAAVAEVVAVAITGGLATVLLLVPLETWTSVGAGVAAGLLAIAWLVARVRRPAGPSAAIGAELGRAAAPFAAAVAASAAVPLLTGSALATAIALAGFGITLVIGPAVGASTTPPSGQALAVGLLGWAPIVGYENRPVAGTIALVGAMLLAEAAVQRTRSGPEARAIGPATLLTVGALVPLATGGAVLAANVELLAVAAGLVLSGWLLALVLDRARTASPLSIVPRVAALIPLSLASGLEPEQAAALGALVAALALLDAVRLREPMLILGAGVGVPVAAVGLALESGWTIHEAGLGVTLTGIVWLGLSGSLPNQWAAPAVLCAAGAGAVGLLLSNGDATAFSTNLLLVGLSAAALGAAVGENGLVVTGLAAATLGIWGHLAEGNVTVSEPYLAPVALLLVIAGWSAYRHQLASSWIAFAPSVGLLGGAALIERLAGGPGWHGLVAGAVGVGAVAAGAVWRLAGPLLVGTALVVAVTVHETMGVTSGLPTPAWLALGGATLLSAGIAMERRGTGPFETGRRLVDIVRERFA